MSKILEWLKGKRTVIIQLGAIFGTVAAYLGGELSLMESFTALWAALTIIYGALKVNAVKDALNGQ